MRYAGLDPALLPGTESLKDTLARVLPLWESRIGPELAAGVSGERFEREIQLAASLQQANIVPILAAGETERVCPGGVGLAGRVLYTHTGVRPLPYKPRGAEGAIREAPREAGEAGHRPYAATRPK